MVDCSSALPFLQSIVFDRRKRKGQQAEELEYVLVVLPDDTLDCLVGSPTRSRHTVHIGSTEVRAPPTNAGMWRAIFLVSDARTSDVHPAVRS